MTNAYICMYLNSVLMTTLYMIVTVYIYIYIHEPAKDQAFIHSVSKIKSRGKQKGLAIFYAATTKKQTEKIHTV